MPTISLLVTSDGHEVKSNTTVNTTDANMIWNGNRTNAYVVDGVSIPAGATIQSARLQFSAAGSRSGAHISAIRGQLGSAAPIAATAGDISARSKTVASVNWDVPAWTSGQRGAAQLSPDLAPVIQETVNDPSWTGEGGLAFFVDFVSGSADRTAAGIGHATLAPAELTVEFVAGEQPADGWAGGLHGVQAQFDEGQPGQSNWWDPVILDQAIAHGIQIDFVRFNFIRGHSEPSPGVYDFSRYTFALDKMHALGIQHTLTLFYGGSPWDNDVAGFAAWALAAVQWHTTNYPGTLAAVEIWNEGDGSWPLPVADYLLVAEAVHNALRALPEFNHIPLCGPASAGGQIAYIQPLVTGGLLNWIDVLSFHKYADPSDIAISMAAVRQVLSDAGQPDFPIYLSEWGGEGNVNPREIAGDLSVIKAEAPFAATYFPLRDYGGFPTSGLLTSTGDTKVQSDTYIEWFARVGDDAEFLGKDVIVPQVHSYKFSKAGAIVRVMWATTPTDILVDGVVTSLTDVPIYVDGDVSVGQIGNDVLLTNFAQDFKQVQGEPWEYGSYNMTDDTWLPAVYDTADGRWEIPGVGLFHYIYPTQFHPHAGWLITARVKFPTAHRLKIQGFHRRGNANGDGVDVWIWLSDGSGLNIAEGFLPPTFEDDYTVVVDVAADTYVNVSCHIHGTESNDATRLECTIYETQDALSDPLPVKFGQTDQPSPVGSAVKLIFGTDGIVHWEPV